MIRNRIPRGVTDPAFARQAAPAEAAIVAAAYGVDTTVIYKIARDWLVDAALMAGATGLDDVETAHHVESDHPKGWTGLLSDPYLLEADEIPGEARFSIVHAAREWLWDASGAGVDAGHEFEALTTDELLQQVRSSYDGGWLQFLADGNPDHQIHQTTTTMTTAHSAEGDPR
ncbi:hypothetical protein ACFCV3_41780 [Kribbella sp. NPDC056345]|uniref:hypothetical protein n=1 Tax=Kribbella sp. NPDC056345 TaxID=3345789 RepID=UPI0035D7EFF9